MTTLEDGSRLLGAEKERYIGQLFDRIAKPYDRLNRLISLGQDRTWRRKAIRAAEISPGQTVVDLGTGTGDLALEALRAVGPEGRVIGIDLAVEMLRGAEAKEADRERYPLVRASAERTGLPTAIADAVTMGWSLRNVGDRAATYAEVLRLLKPGGVFACLEMSHPESLPARIGHRLYTALAMPVMARTSGGEYAAYRYLANSTARFPGREELAREWRAAGFVDVIATPLCLGSLAIHRGRRPH